MGEPAKPMKRLLLGSALLDCSLRLTKPPRRVNEMRRKTGSSQPDSLTSKQSFGVFGSLPMPCPILLEMPANPHKPGEDRAEKALIEQISRRQGNRSFPGLILGIGDDCAVLKQKSGEQIVVTTDLSIEGRHFRLEWHPPEVVGHRTLARGLSDLAAMGARPLAAFLSLALPPDLTRSTGRQKSWFDRFLDGFFDLARRHKTPLAGGDLAQGPIATADIVLIGTVPRGRALLRSHARPGDFLYVTGTLGGSAAGLAKLIKLGRRSAMTSQRLSISKSKSAAFRAHFHPQPRLAQGRWLQTRGAATAAIDLSDGLSTDLAHLCENSGVAAEVNYLPVAPGATEAQAMHGGEDYELLFAASPATHIPRALSGVTISKIGRILPRRAGHPTIVLRNGSSIEPIEPRGWQHFA
jgi:thiamine-monophosphate kinase